MHSFDIVNLLCQLENNEISTISPNEKSYRHAPKPKCSGLVDAVRVRWYIGQSAVSLAIKQILLYYTLLHCIIYISPSL